MSRDRLDTWDSFDDVRKIGRDKMKAGELTADEYFEYVKREDAKLYADSEKRDNPYPEPAERTYFPDQGHKTRYGFKETDGSITPPDTNHLNKWNEHD